MIHIVLVVFVLLGLMVLLTMGAILGRHFGRLQLKHHVEHKLEVVVVAESAVFALLGLLIAFSFSGAYDRYETKKLHILAEANVFDTAYESIDLLLPQFQSELRAEVREYLDWHITSYSDIPYETKVVNDLNHSIELQHKIWKNVVAASQANATSNLSPLVIPTFSKMFEIAHEGINMTLVHPPRIIFILLIGLSMLGAFLIGYNSAENKQKYPVHLLSYVLLTAFTIYIIMNLEYPRVGFIRYNTFDEMLTDVRQDMNYVG